MAVKRISKPTWTPHGGKCFHNRTIQTVRGELSAAVQCQCVDGFSLLKFNQSTIYVTHAVGTSNQEKYFPSPYELLKQLRVNCWLPYILCVREFNLTFVTVRGGFRIFLKVVTVLRK